LFAVAALFELHSVHSQQGEAQGVIAALPLLFIAKPKKTRRNRGRRTRARVEPFHVLNGSDDDDDGSINKNTTNCCNLQTQNPNADVDRVVSHAGAHEYSRAEIISITMMLMDQQ
jgi:hypothetical protein